MESTRRELLTGAIATAAIGMTPRAGLAAPGTLPGRSGPVAARADGERLSVSNELVAAEWAVSPRGLFLSRVEDRRSRAVLEPRRGPFTITLGDMTVLDAARLAVSGAPRVEDLPADPRAARAAERVPGKRVAVDLTALDGRLAISWRAVLREGSHYVRQEVTLRARGGEVAVAEVCLVDLPLPGAAVVGSVKGSPVVGGAWFCGLEHPLSESAASGGRARCWLARALPLHDGRELTLSSAVGVAPAGQTRRAFQAYVERERAHPYRTFLHYNSWYDLGYFTKFDEAGALAVIDAFGTELVAKRAATLDSFLFDDGWDDTRFWGFHDGFPRGFTPLKEAAARYGAAPGVWLSPWGGYGKPKQERLRYGKERGFETNEGGFALSGPTYYARFREVCLEMIRKYGVNQFKIDGTGNASTVVPGSEFGSDFEAALALIADLRRERPELFVNLTTGTYPSPYWLWTADSTWRGGEDHEFTGEGTDRQRWITYRDADTFQGVVMKGPLYPLGALMLHGLIFAKHAKKLDTDPGGDFDAEVRSYFGTGTQLQEMYVTPALLSAKSWDVLGECARWSRKHADVLVDTHWVGGDPARLEVYGWASWAPRKGILTLRNPAAEARSFEIDVARHFELPPGHEGPYRLKSPFRFDAARPALNTRAGETVALTLAPFEVRTLEAIGFEE